MEREREQEHERILRLHSTPAFFSDAQTGRNEIDRVLVRSRLRSWTAVADSRGLHASLSSRSAFDRHGILLHDHLLGDLARYETPISYDIATRVSPIEIKCSFVGMHGNAINLQSQSAYECCSRKQQPVVSRKWPERACFARNFHYLSARGFGSAPIERGREECHFSAFDERTSQCIASAV